MKFPAVLAVLILTTLILAGCGGGGGSSQAAPAANNAPTISGQPATAVVAGQAYSFTPSANDADGDTLTFSISNQPSWASFSNSTGQLSGTPASGDVGTYQNVTISVSDGQASAALSAFNISVNAQNSAPVISGTAAPQVLAGNSYAFSPDGTDADGDTLTYSIQNQPAFTSFSTSTGALTGTPDASDVGVYSGILISVSDGSDSAALPAFNLEVLGSFATNAAIRFFGNGSSAPGEDRVLIEVYDANTSNPGPPVDVGEDDFTLEFWIRGRGSDNSSVAVTCSDAADWLSGSVVLDRLPDQGPGYGISLAQGRLVVAVNAASAASLCGAASVLDDGWHHVVLQRRSSDGRIWIYVDGALDVTTTGPSGDVSYPDAASPSQPLDTHLVLGAHRDDAAPAFSGWLDDLRFSQGLRYSGSFTPPTSRLSVDAATLALYVADDGPGALLADENGNQSPGMIAYGGNPAGPVWETSGAPTGAGSSNGPPTLSGTPASQVVVGNTYSFTPSASDPDNDPLTFSITNRPGWASFNTSTGVLTGTPQAGDAGTYADIQISVSDGALSDTLPAFSVTVSTSNSAPSISGSPPTQAAMGVSYSFTPTASDPENDPLTFSITNLPGWAAFNTSTGALTGTPQAGDVGTYNNIIISVSDGSLSDALPGFQIEVTLTNDAPSISGTPAAQVVAGNAYSFSPTASDPDGDPLSFSIANRPAWLSFNTSTGVLSGTPQSGDVGTYTNILISVSDGLLSDSLAAFSIEVQAANSAPSISGAPGTSVTAGNAYAFTPSASDPDGDPLTFSIANRPGWASFNTSTGALTGTPQNGDAGNYTGIVISVSDGALSDALPAFSIEVIATNTAPTISGTPATSVAVGNAYSFTPTASDPEGDPLTFSITNRPSWASFNTSTGALTGTPGGGDIGSYNNVSISVSDGSLSDDLPAFSIQVTAASSNYALRFYGAGSSAPDQDRVKIRIDDPNNNDPGPPADIGATDFTVEFWMLALASENTSSVGCGAGKGWIDGNIIYDRDRYSQPRDYGISIGDNRIAFGVVGTSAYTLCSTSNILDGTWHHIAVQRRVSDGMLWIHIDGVLEGSATGPAGDISYPDDGVPGGNCGGPCVNSDPFIVLGAEKHDAGPAYPAYSGLMDELRLSTELRYGVTNFTPPSSRFTPDASTAALYHFDSGSGTDIIDSTPGNQSPGVMNVGGNPAGPEWQVSTAPTD